MMTVKELREHLDDANDDAVVLVEANPGGVNLLPLKWSHQCPVGRSPDRHISTYRRRLGNKPAIVLTVIA